MALNENLSNTGERILETGCKDTSQGESLVSNPNPFKFALCVAFDLHDIQVDFLMLTHTASPLNAHILSGAFLVSPPYIQSYE